jgi:hypothetical protein
VGQAHLRKGKRKILNAVRNIEHHLTGHQEAAPGTEVEAQTLGLTSNVNGVPHNMEDWGDNHPDSMDQMGLDDEDDESYGETADPEVAVNSELTDVQILKGVENLNTIPVCTDNQDVKLAAIVLDPTDLAMAEILQYAQQRGTSLQFIDEIFL